MSDKDLSYFRPVSLIEEIKKRPALYKSEQPIDREERLQLWKEVGAAIFADEWETYNKATAYDKVLQLQKKWRSLRDAYNRELRTRKSNNRDRKKVYKYFKKMSFLGGFNGTISEEEEQQLSGQETADVQSDHGYSTPFIESQDSPKPKFVRKSKKRQRRRRSSDSIQAPEEIELQAFPLEVPGDNDDSDKLFMLSFVPEMRQLPGNLKMWVRAQIANAMQEAVSCHYNNTTPRSSAVCERNDLETI